MATLNWRTMKKKELLEELRKTYITCGKLDSRLMRMRTDLTTTQNDKKQYAESIIEYKMKLALLEKIVDKPEKGYDLIAELLIKILTEDSFKFKVEYNKKTKLKTLTLRDKSNLDFKSVLLTAEPMDKSDLEEGFVLCRLDFISNSKIIRSKELSNLQFRDIQEIIGWII